MVTEQEASLYIKRMRALYHPMEPMPTGLTEKLVPLPGVRAILFDVYGTLFISGVSDTGIVDPHTEEKPFLDSLAAVGLSLTPGAQVRLSDKLRIWITNEHTQRKKRGDGHPEIEIRQAWMEILEQLQREHLLEGTIHPGLAPLYAVECECRTNPVWPMPGMEAMLRTMRARAMPMGIVSNAQFLAPLLFKALLDATPEELGFSTSLCVWSYKVLGAKPSLRLFKQALNVLQRDFGVMPGETLYIGNDMLGDIWPAQRAGCKTALFAGDRRSLRLREDDPRCRNIQPDVTLTAWPQLSSVLESEQS